MTLLVLLLNSPFSPAAVFAPPIALTKVPLLSPCRVQGNGEYSPYLGRVVRVQGVVFADFDNLQRKGFFLQVSECDQDPATSDGLFVYLGESQDVVSAGDWVEVRGTVAEYYGNTELDASPENVKILTTGNPLPEAMELTPPLDKESSLLYYEAAEGMYVQIDQALVVGPTNASGESWIVRNDSGLTRVMQGEGTGTGAIVGLDEQGLYRVEPQVKVGDKINGISGALAYVYGSYRIHLTSQPIVINGSVPARQIGARQFVNSTEIAIATFNLEDLFDTFDDPEVEDPVLSASAYQRKLEKSALVIHTGLGEPALLVVQEIENMAVLQALVARPEISVTYGIVWSDSVDIRGIDNALLFRQDKVHVDAYETRQGCTSIVDGLGPDGNLDMENPQNTITCDVNGDGMLDGNRLFSRPPMLAWLQVCVQDCQASSNWYPLVLVINHWKSKRQDGKDLERTQPRRIEQSAFVASIITDIRLDDPGRAVLIAGDLNDFPDSVPLSNLTQAGMRDLTSLQASSSQYSYIYHGVSQILDYLLLSPSLALVPQSVESVHVNADYPFIFSTVGASPYRSSDHDPVLAVFRLHTVTIYLPAILH